MNAPASSTRGPLLALIIAAAVLAIYFPALRGDWLWDDGTLILQNHFIHDPAGLGAIWTKPIDGTEYLPLTSSVEWLEWQAFGANTPGYHLASLALHIASALLVWRLFAKLGLHCAWIGGLLFAVHPVAVESVAWISELKNTLSLPPFLLAMCAWIDFDRSGRRKDYYLALVCFLVAMLCKPTALMFPATILLYTWWRRGRIGTKDLLASGPFFAISLAFGLLASILARTGAEPSPVIAGVGARLATAGWQILLFLGKCILPTHLLPLYPGGLVVSPSPADLLPWLLIVVLLLTAWWRRKTWGRHVLLGLGFFLLHLVPVLGFIYANATTMTWSMEHLVYLPLIGIIGLAVAGFDLALAKSAASRRALIIGAAAAVCELLATESFLYAGIFANQGTLWSYDLTGNPDSATAHNNLGLYELDHQHYAEAIDHFRAALRIKPDFAYAHNGLGNALGLTGHAADAATEYQAALAIDPHYAEAHNGLASVLLAEGRLDEARTHCELSIQANPHYADAYCNLGLIDAQQGKIADAIRQFEIARKLRPDDPRIAQALESLRARQP